MKITKTEFKKTINNSSSWIIYIANNKEDAHSIYNMEMTKREMMRENGWYYTVSHREVRQDCRVPTFFHEHGYWMTVVEHNNGDWDKKATYTLYIVE